MSTSIFNIFEKKYIRQGAISLMGLLSLQYGGVTGAGERDW